MAIEIKANDEVVLTLTDTEVSLIETYNYCCNRWIGIGDNYKKSIAKYIKMFKEEWIPKLIENGVTMVPITDEGFVQLVLSQTDESLPHVYKSKKIVVTENKIAGINEEIDNRNRQIAEHQERIGELNELESLTDEQQAEIDVLATGILKIQEVIASLEAELAETQVIIEE